MRAIVTLTMNPCIDTGAQVSHVTPEKKLRCHSLRHEPGGGGVNVARGVKKLGGDSVAYLTSGGPLGLLLQKLLDLEEIHYQAMEIEHWTRESFIVYEESSGQQFRFSVPGPSLAEEEWKDCLDALSDSNPRPDFIVVSGGLPQGVPKDFYSRVARLARELGSKMILDTSGEELEEALREGVFLIKPNLRELKDLAETDMEEEPKQEEFARQIVQNGGSKVVVVSRGAGGSLAVWDGHCEHLRAPTVSIKSKVGAGDSMVAGIVLSLARGNDIREAVRFGMAAGAAAVMTQGTQLCRREDTERLYDRMTSGA